MARRTRCLRERRRTGVEGECMRRARLRPGDGDDDARISVRSGDGAEPPGSARRGLRTPPTTEASREMNLLTCT